MKDSTGVSRQAYPLFESAMDPIVMTDRAQRIVAFNDAAESAFGWTRAEAIGQPLDLLIPARFRDRHHAHFDAFARTGTTSRRMGTQAVLVGLRKNGEEFPIEASICQFTDDGEPRLAAIVRDVTEREKAMADLLASKRELSELGAAAEATREQEKSRIARELHDELGQALTMMRMDVAWCRANLAGAGPAAQAKLERMESLLKSTVAATRRISSDLRPLMLDDLGLVPALEWLAQNMSQRTGIACDFSIDDPAVSLPPSHSTAVFRIVQEALTNIAKHARAKHAEVAVRHEEGVLEIAIRDDGVGFATDDPRKPESFGLLGLRERISLVRGTAIIDSKPGAGTTIVVRVPLVAAENA